MKNLILEPIIEESFIKIMPIYKKAIDEIPDGNNEDSYLWLDRNYESLTCGICYAVFDELEIDISKEIGSLGKKLEFPQTWYKPPYLADGQFITVKDTLIWRYNKMQELLEISNKNKLKNGKEKTV